MSLRAKPKPLLQPCMAWQAPLPPPLHSPSDPRACPTLAVVVSGLLLTDAWQAQAFALVVSSGDTFSPDIHMTCSLTPGS